MKMSNITNNNYSVTIFTIVPATSGNEWNDDKDDYHVIMTIR